MSLKPFPKPRFVADEPPELRPQHVRQRFRMSRKQHPGVRIGPDKEEGAMQRNDGLARAGRAGHPRRAAVIALNQGALRRMKKDRPFVPGVVERALQFLYVGHYAGAALSVGMRERIGSRDHRLGGLRNDTCCEIQQRLGSLTWKGIGPVPVRCPHWHCARPPAIQRERRSSAAGLRRRPRTRVAWDGSPAPPRRTWEPGFPAPSPGFPQAARRPSWGGFRVSAVRRSDTRRRGEPHSKAAGWYRFYARSAGRRYSLEPNRIGDPSPYRACGIADSA